MNILIADQSELNITAMSLILKDIFSGCIVYPCYSWEDVKTKLKLNFPNHQENKVDLVLLEISILNQTYNQDNGQSKWYLLLESIIKKYKHIPVCVISDSLDKTHLQMAFEVGAKGYVLKTETVSTIKDSLLKIHEGKIHYPKQLLQPAYANKVDSVLTLRQQEILGLVAEGYPNKTIATKLGLTEYTVKRHVYNICKKLNAKNRIDAVNKATLNFMLSN